MNPVLAEAIESRQPYVDIAEDLNYRDLHVHGSPDMSQTLYHAHPHDGPHGYFEHPEDEQPIATYRTPDTGQGEYQFMVWRDGHAEVVYRSNPAANWSPPLVLNRIH